ncbi:uncharacterized protein LOC134406434 [Elgaria multicarinata webbii]|uniref:uncharacterized protein LOC134406434 n=1 Tax=Elgaria multicarinata webbii TaxID=159646 RepID=UPI002FCD3A88
MGMEAEDRPPSQSLSTVGKGAPEAKTPAAGGGILEAAQCLRPGSQIAAKEPAVASETSQEPSKITHTGQPSHLGNRDVAKAPVAIFKASKKSKTSAAPSKPGTNAPQLKMPSPRPSKKPSPTRGSPSPRPSKKLSPTKGAPSPRPSKKPSPTKGAPSPKPTRGATRKTGKASPRTKISVGMGHPMVDTDTMAAAPSDPDNSSRAWEQGKPRGPSPQRRGTADGQRSSSQPPAVSGPSPKPRVSVGVSRSVTETKSMGVGRSATHTFSEATGPSVPASSPPKSHVPGSEAAGLTRQVSKARSRLPVNRAPKLQRLDVVKLEDKTIDETRKSPKPRKAAVPSGPSRHE